MKQSEFIFDSVDVLHYNLNKISLNRGGSYDSPKWLKNKKQTINLKYNDDDKCFQYVITGALNYKNNKINPQRLTKIKPFINHYNWKEINFPLHRKDWKKFESNNKSIALNILHIPYNTEKIRHVFKSKNNLNSENHLLILLMITDGEKWHYLAVKKLCGLFRGKTSKNNGDFYCLKLVSATF